MQSRLVKHAWYILSTAPPQKTDTYYQLVALGAMQHEKGVCTGGDAWE